MTHPAKLTSRLPNVGTTIFTTMSALAQKTGAINLGQGFPDFDCDPALLDCVNAAMRSGHNQYPPMAGVAKLREVISAKTQTLYGAHYHPDSEITITAGGTQAVLTAVMAIVQPGDEVIVLQPAFDSYLPNIELAGGVAVPVNLSLPDYQIDWPAVHAAITPRTKLVIINSPHNPSGRIISRGDLEKLGALAQQHGFYVLSDEVYEHMVYDQAAHISAAQIASLRERCVVVSSFGKTLHVTGWKVGYVAAPEPLMSEFRKVHQFNVFTVNTPMQYGIAAYLENPASYLNLPAFYQAKRDRFRAGLAQSAFTLLPCEGTYFQVVNYQAIAPHLDETQFCEWLCHTHGVVAIPMNAFYQTPENHHTVRFCFAKRDETIDAALLKLSQVKAA